MKLGDLEFKAEDFERLRDPLENRFSCHEAAQIANALLAERLENAEKVFGGKQNVSWRFHSDAGDFPWNPTHTARLVCIEELTPPAVP